MSEYQYYEFRAVDRPLDEEQMDELRRVSSRAVITPTSLTNTYHWGSFKGNPKKLMERYFDAFVYVANWGSHDLMLRVPLRLFDTDAARAYCDDEVFSVETHEAHAVLSFSSQQDGGDDWMEDGGEWMASLISLRAEIMRGDYRALYLGWLASIRWLADADDGTRAFEPPVPAGLAKLSAAQQTLADFLRIEDDLLAAAAAVSAGDHPSEASHAELVQWLERLPVAERDAYLVRFVTEEEGDSMIRAELFQRFREATKPENARSAPNTRLRTVAELLAARDVLIAEKRRKRSEQAAQEKARRDREAAEKRAQYLDELSRREPAGWLEVEKLIGTKQPDNYDQAVTLLIDLRELAERAGRADEADARIQSLREKHRLKTSLIKRLDNRRLGK
jgi:hypothetical protein